MYMLHTLWSEISHIFMKASVLSFHSITMLSYCIHRNNPYKPMFMQMLKKSDIQ